DRSCLEIHVAPSKRCRLTRPAAREELEGDERIPERFPSSELYKNLVSLFRRERVRIFARDLRPGDKREWISELVTVEFTCIAVKGAQMPIDEIADSLHADLPSGPLS